VMIPTIDTTTSTSTSLQEILVVSAIKAHIETIIWGALVLHVVYGVVTGFVAAIALRDGYKRIPRKSLFELESESMPAT